MCSDGNPHLATWPSNENHLKRFSFKLILEPMLKSRVRFGTGNAEAGSVTHAQGGMAGPRRTFLNNK